MKARENPFRSYKVEKIPYSLQDISWECLYRRLETLHYRAAIVGSEGVGKTTLLEKLARDFKQENKDVCFLSLTQEQPYFSRAFLKKIKSRLKPETFVFLDGADMMSPLRWKIFSHLTRAAAGLIITTHSLQWLPELIYCRTNRTVLKTVLNALLEDVPSELWSLSCRRLNQRQGNVREVLRDLYEHYATCDLGSTSHQTLKIHQP